MDEQAAVRARREGPDYRTDRQVGGALDAHRLLHWAQTRGRQQQLITALPGTGTAPVRGDRSPLHAMLRAAVTSRIN
ncbi:hypothetical protein GTZ78_23335 [Streptomyces sp. SID8361]|uniref:hypothetical protein n=1 Tax=Streptomyces sp. MnatMP-M27 TaxID=1839768 RepID=UPI00081EE98C|nr:hypothetical protein [Streptomyces sp. MnatMP-M27]MYU13541.1 hypothetical protein [Streptomyces sp. SID8361]SCG01128.1 hypothetical protein GA0115260_1061812 [Streptomyces sp. MnatMP-M27]